MRRTVTWAAPFALVAVSWLETESPRRAFVFLALSVVAAGAAYAGLRPVLRAEGVIRGGSGWAIAVGRSLRGSSVRWLALVALVAVGAALYVHGVEEQAARNTDVESTDQSAYLYYARSLSEAPDQVVPDRNRVPLFPFIVSVADPHPTSLEASFRRAKTTAVVLSVFALLVIAVLSARLIGSAGAVVVTTATAFGVVMIKAPWVQADVLWYLLFAVGVVLCCTTLQRPSLWSGVAVGLVLGFAQLTKSGGLPLLMLFLVAAFVAAAWHKRLGDGLAGPMLLVVPVAVVMFVLVVAPYAMNNQRIYGSPWFNSVTSHYIWYDTDQQLLQPGGAFVNPAADPNTGAPTASTYLASHSIGDIGRRIRDGLRTELLIARTDYFVWQLLAVIAFAVYRPRRAWALVSERLVPAAFLIGVLATYVVLFAWYMPIAPVPRFGLVLFVPFAMGTVWFIDRVGRDQHVRIHDQVVAASTIYYAIAMVVLALFAVHASLVTAARAFGGD